MNTDRNIRLDEIFRLALGFDGSERDEFIADCCKGDPELQQQIMSLLEAANKTDDAWEGRFEGIRERFWRNAFSEEEIASEDLSGQRVNAWCLVRRIARGGLGTVYLAERADGAFEQTVAFKVLRRGLDTDDVVARFQVERQILSALDHPSIAQILDGGVLPDGRPYLVLDYVSGRSITRFCAEERLAVGERVKLLIDVLDALHHAHRHLIVHRDVKPSNILVSDERHATLLDFGIAKLLDPLAVPGGSMTTRAGVSLLTPGYSSPEQMAGQVVTTASDIYQAGLVMYELLTGATPFADAARPLNSTLPPPSHLLRGQPDYPIVRGDLDAIASKALHVDPLQRYTSADEMRSDLKRYLEGVAQCLLGLSLEKQGRVDEGNAMVESSHPLLRKGSVPEPYGTLCRMPETHVIAN